MSRSMTLRRSSGSITPSSAFRIASRSGFIRLREYPNALAEQSRQEPVLGLPVRLAVEPLVLSLESVVLLEQRGVGAEPVSQRQEHRLALRAGREKLDPDREPV